MLRAVTKKEGTGVKSEKGTTFRDQTEPRLAEILDREGIRAEEMEQGFIAAGRNGQAAYDGGNAQEISTCHKANNDDHKPSIGGRSGEAGFERGKLVFNKI